MRHKTVFIFRDGAYKFSQKCFFFTLRKRKLQLGELIGISNLRTAFNLKKFSLKKGETGDIGYVSGLMTIMHAWSSASPNIIYVDTFNHKYTSVAGNEIEKMPLTVSWKGTGWDSIMQITSNYGGTSAATEFTVAFQSIQ